MPGRRSIAEARTVRLVVRIIAADGGQEVCVFSAASQIEFVDLLARS